MEILGKYGVARVFTDDVEKGAFDQITNLLNQEFVKGSKIRIMPDVHQGVGCVIGFTANMGDILGKIEDTVDVLDILKPIYNFKA